MINQSLAKVKPSSQSICVYPRPSAYISNKKSKCLIEQGKPFFIVLNQVDKIEPFREWDEQNKQPGLKQLQNIRNKISVVSNFFSLPESKILPVSAAEQYNLISLIDEIVFALPNEKKLTFAEKVKRENVSQKSKERAENGFWNTVWVFVKEVVPIAVEVLEHIPVVGSFVKGIKKVFKWFF